MYTYSNLADPLAKDTKYSVGIHIFCIIYANLGILSQAVCIHCMYTHLYNYNQESCTQ